MSNYDKIDVDDIFFGDDEGFDGEDLSYIDEEDDDFYDIDL